MASAHVGYSIQDLLALRSLGGMNKKHAHSYDHARPKVFKTPTERNWLGITEDSIFG